MMLEATAQTGKRTSYPAYKDSGVEWLGEVPTHWEITRLKDVAIYWVSNVDKIATDDELPVRLCNYTDVYYHDYIRPDMGLMETTATAQEINRFGLQVDDVVITKDSEDWSDIGVPALVVESASDLVCGYHLAIIRPQRPVLVGKFLLRTLQADAVNRQFQVAATGVTRYGLPKSSIGEAWLPLPSQQEQRAIATFLDHETEKIDTLVAKKRTLIERLKEERTALITHTVTRGLPPEAARAAGLEPHPKLKPSGVEWLGEVPTHWEIVALRRYAKQVQTGSTPPTVEERFYENGSIPWYGPASFDDQIVVTRPVKMIHESAVREGVVRCFAKGTTLVVTIGATLGKVSSLDAKGSCNQQITAIEFDPKIIYSRFATYQIKRLELIFRAVAPRATLPILDQNEIADTILALPPPREQEIIAAFLDRQTEKIDTLMTKIETAIERLQEYRSALITAAVTGKTDVREEAAL